MKLFVDLNKVCATYPPKYYCRLECYEKEEMISDITNKRIVNELFDSDIIVRYFWNDLDDRGRRFFQYTKNETEIVSEDERREFIRGMFRV